MRWGCGTLEDVIRDVTISYHNYPTKTVKRRKRKDNYVAECKKAYEDFIAEWRELMQANTMEGVNTRNYWSRYNEAPHSLRFKYYVSPFYYKKVKKDLEEEIAEAIKDFSKGTRDGKASETKRKKGFRAACAKTVRVANKRLTKQILKEAEYDNKPYPDTYLGKPQIWDWY